MTGEKAWELLAPTLVAPVYKRNDPVVDEWTDAYVTMFIGTQLYDSWVAHGKPEEWKEPPKKGAK